MDYGAGIGGPMVEKTTKKASRTQKKTTSTRPQKKGLANKDVNMLPTTITMPVYQNKEHVDNGK